MNNERRIIDDLKATATRARSWRLVMNLYHYSKDPQLEIRSRKAMLEMERDLVAALRPNDPRRPQLLSWLDPVRTFGRGNKPVYAFWFSDEDEYGWSEWNIENEHGLDEYCRRYPVVLSPAVPWLTIAGEDDLDRFSRQYGIQDTGRHRYDRIDWDQVKADCAGVVITPYVWSRRSYTSAGWYMTWDCASGFAFDPEGTITLGHPEKIDTGVENPAQTSMLAKG